MNPIFPATRHWRHIPQQVTPRTMPAEGRRRLLIASLKTAATLAVVAAFAWGALAVSTELGKRNPAKPAPAATGAAPVAAAPVLGRTDGVLSAEWVARTLALPRGATLTQLDLARLQRRLLASGQVRAATLTKNFPATLTVALEERSPIARLTGPDGAALFVARDGVAYAGESYPAALVDSLPRLEAAATDANAPGDLPRVARMEAVADLLATAKLDAPQLYDEWRAVSLARLGSDGELVVRTAAGAAITFNVRDTFLSQLAELDLIRDRLAAEPAAPQAINLALGRNPSLRGRDVVVLPAVAAAPEFSSTRPARAVAPAAPVVPVFKIFSPH